MTPQYDREELFQKVWNRLMIKVAEEYAVSSVALAKACRKLSVPVAGRDHWAKLAQVIRRPKPVLPKLEKVPVTYRTEKAAETFDRDTDPELAAIEELLTSGALNPPADDAETRL